MKKEKKTTITGDISFIDRSGRPLDEIALNQLSENLILAILASAEPDEDEEVDIHWLVRDG